MSVITMFPSKQAGNAYTLLLYQALESIGLRYVEIPFSLRYLLRRGPSQRFHYLHFHWPETFFLIRPRQPHKLFGLKGFLLLHASWFLAKLRGYKIVWTLHEVDPHNARMRNGFYMGSRRLLWRLADIVFTHSNGVRETALRRWGIRKHVYTIPHGNYDGAYPSSMTLQEARQRLGIPASAFTFAFFGNIHPYKGVDILTGAFRAVQSDFPEVHLVIAGNPGSPEYSKDVRSALENVPNAHLTLSYIPDHEIQMYLRAADCLVAPYRQLETTGIIHLALTFDLPIIITAKGNVAEFESESIGIFMDDAQETEAAMRRMLAISQEERAAWSGVIRKVAQRYSWGSLEGQYREVFAGYEGKAESAGGESLAGSDVPQAR